MQNRSRAILVLILLACGFTVISFNLIQIQLVQHDKYWRMAIENHLHPETIPAKRGAIYDCDGNILAQTQETTDIWLDGKLIDHPAIQLPQIAKTLGLPADQVLAGFDPKNRYANLAWSVDDATVTKLRTLKLRGLIYSSHDVRSYPNNELAAHVLGFIDKGGHGVAGIEKEMDRLLRGVPGERYVERDARKKEIAGYQTREMPAVDGDNVTLTINTAIQHAVEESLDQIVQTYQPKGAYIIVMEPRTGEIMAMGSRPTYDPNDSKSFTKEGLSNRCITDAVEPGSIFKIIPLSAALNEGKLTLDTPINCENGSFYYGGKILKDDEKNGTLPAIEVLAQSSNIGFAKIALEYLNEEKLYQYVTAFGMGQRTGVLPGQGESPGLIRPVDKWSALSITRIPMGQEILVTPIQIATAMSVIANGGRLVAPRLIKQVTDENGQVVQVYQPKIVRQVISSETALDVAKALRQVTIDGTAKKIRIDGYSWAGKTGTAQVFVDGAYSHTKFVSSFVGFLPAQDPAFVALVMVREPNAKPGEYYGSAVSAPVFASLSKQIAQILNIAPDQPVTTPTLGALTPSAL